MTRSSDQCRGIPDCDYPLNFYAMQSLLVLDDQRGGARTYDTF
jgi:hypothetical protein